MAAKPAVPEPIIAEIEELLRQQQSPPIERCLAMCKREGAVLNNLFWTSGGQYQCNLRTRTPYEFFEFAWGVTPADAILKALLKFVRGRRVDPVRPSDEDALANVVGSTTAAETAIAPVGEIDDEDLLG
jgi:hypothetical protein